MIKTKYKTSAWQRKEGQDPKGGLNAKGRAAYKKETGGTLKPPAPNPKTKEDAGRKKSYCARSAGQMKQFPKAAANPKSRLRLARKAWGC